MTVAKYDQMSLNELRQYVLTHREDIKAFHHYVDRSKSEGNMRILDLNNDQWEDQVKAAIRDSSQAIRWYFDRNEDNSDHLANITNWWQQLDNRTVIKYHITGMEVDIAAGIWEPTQLNSPQEIIIHEPQIKLGQVTAFVQYKNQEGLPNSLEAVAIDLDLTYDNLFVWSSHSKEVFIFSKIDHQNGNK